MGFAATIKRSNKAHESATLYVKDKITQLHFLIDTGADISVLPRRYALHHTREREGSLYAANGSSIATYGRTLRTVDFGLGKSYAWEFTTADVTYPILGADFLKHFQLAVNLHDRTISDRTQGKTIKGTVPTQPHSTISALQAGPHVELLKQFPSLTETSAVVAPVNHDFKHAIPTGDKPPTYCRPRKLNPKISNFAIEAFKRMENEGIVRKSNSPYASPLHMAPKRDTWRVVGDYRALNKDTIRDTYPLPYLHDFTLHLHGTRIFSNVDLKDAFHQLPIREEDIPKTCITTPFGAYEYLRMNFGLAGAAQTFQRFIDAVLKDVNVNYPDGTTRKVTLFAYVDDILIASVDEEQHKEDLLALFQRLSQFNLRLNIEKCRFFQTSLDFLGRKLTGDGLQPLDEKVVAIRDFPLPKTYLCLRRL